jgi:hypothetical protein
VCAGKIGFTGSRSKRVCRYLAAMPVGLRVDGGVPKWERIWLVNLWDGEGHVIPRLKGA